MTSLKDNNSDYDSISSATMTANDINMTTFCHDDMTNNSPPKPSPRLKRKARKAKKCFI